jgi:predicted metal-dependent enzyme (double-stranded beta helix superfamily)
MAQIALAYSYIVAFGYLLRNDVLIAVSVLVPTTLAGNVVPNHDHLVQGIVDKYPTRSVFSQESPAIYAINRCKVARHSEQQKQTIQGFLISLIGVHPVIKRRQEILA